MPIIDNDAMIRDRAYSLWETAGHPSGLEHEHWAEARRQIEAEMAAATPIEVVLEVGADESLEKRPQEVIRLRQALYAPEPFSFELFGDECPKIDLPIIVRQAA